MSVTSGASGGTDSASRDGLSGRMARFGVVGAIGFVVDAGVMQLLFSLGIAPLLGRCVSFPAAVTTTWWLNRRYTFVHRMRLPSHVGYPLYVVGQIVGGLLNVGVFAFAVRARPSLAAHPVVPLALGAALAMVFNYAWSSMLVFRSRSLDEPPAQARR